LSDSDVTWRINSTAAR